MTLLSLAPLLLALAGTASPVKRDLWTNNTCTGSIAGDTTLVPAIPTALIDYLISDLKAVRSYNGSSESTSLSHKSYCTSKNDTSVIVVRDGASLEMDYVNLLKYGYNSDLNQASFFGVNAVVNVANASSLTASHLNITSHNGAAGLYSYGSGTNINVTDSLFYASGPVSHGVYASGNGTANVTNFYCKTEGYRSSCFSGDSPGGYITVRDSEAYTYGLGSAVMYTLGEEYLHNVKGYADLSPWTYIDGTQQIYVFDSDLEGGNMAGVILFSSQGSGRLATVIVTDSILRTHGANAAAIAVAGTTGNVHLNSVTMMVESDILIAANTSTNPQSFDHWVSPAELGAVIPGGAAHVYVSQSQLQGDLLAINGSSIDFYLSNYSVWTGQATLNDIVDTSAVAVYLDASSAWSLTGDSVLQNFTITENSLANIESNGFDIYYNASQSCNVWTNGTSLTGGGALLAY